MIKKLLVLLAFLIPSLSWAEVNEANFSLVYELDATAITYCRVTGKNGDPFGGPIAGIKKITTSGSSATTTEVTTDDLPFADLAVGDILFVDPGTGASGVLTRVITAKASGASITVNAAWNLSATGGYSFRWLKNNCGTTATDGWIDVGNSSRLAITIQVDQYTVTGGINFQVQCRKGFVGSLPEQIWPSCTTGACNTVQNYASTAGITSRTTIYTEAPFASCRVGQYIHTSDDGSDTTTDAEQITIGLTKVY
jgi:hypothetical protein